MSNIKPDALFNVEGLVTVITGGGTGIGLMLARALESNGAIVYILGRRRDVLEEAAATAKHGKLYPIVTDVTSKSDLEAAAQHVKEKSGYVNLVIANAGINGPTLYDLPPEPSFEQFRDFLQGWSVEECNQTFAINSTAVFTTMVAFLDLLAQGNKAGNVKQKSQFINVSSVGAYNRMPLAGFMYNSSKAAAVHLVKQFATSMAPYGIRANGIAPGLFPSEMSPWLLESYENGRLPKSFIPEGRIGDIEDMAGVVLYLASRAGAYMNGNVLIPDGGAIGLLPATY